MRIEIFKKILPFIILLFIYGIYENIINKPFPFVYINYNSYNKFNAAPEDLDINISLNITKTDSYKFKKFLTNFKEVNSNNLDDDIKAGTLAVNEIMHTSKGNRLRKTTDTISIQKDYKNICSESSKVFVALMQSMNYPARVIWMNGHTVSEIYSKPYGWILVDTYANIIFKDKDGKYQSLLDVNRNYKNLTPFNIVKSKYKDLPNYLRNGYIYQENNIYRIQNLFVIIDGKSLDNFHNNTHNPTSILKASILGKPFATGIQYITKNNQKIGNVGVSIYKRFY